MNNGLNTPHKFTSWIEKNDDPALAKDHLDREQFTNHLAKTIESWAGRESKVGALYGGWGTGKTWILRRLELHLNSSSTIRVCNFSPWQYRGVDAITAEFFDVIGEKFHDNLKARDKWTLFSRLSQVSGLGFSGLSTVALLSGAPTSAAILAGAGAIGKTLEALANTASKSKKIPTLQETRKELIKIFSHKKFDPILVVLDDFDRLTDIEIQGFIRLIKTNADLPNLHYLILGDRNQISKAMDSICGNKGNHYMEKVVHYPLTVPAPSAHKLRTRLIEGMQKIASKYRSDLPHEPIRVRLRVTH